jgi:hypothetical protein
MLLPQEGQGTSSPIDESGISKLNPQCWQTRLGMML